MLDRTLIMMWFHTRICHYQGRENQIVVCFIYTWLGFTCLTAKCLLAQQPCGPAVTYYFTAWIKQAGVCKSQGISLYQYRSNQRCGSGNKVSSLQHFQVLVTKINVLYNLGNNDYAWGEDGGHNTCVSLSCYRIVLWCFLLTELSLKFDICNDRSCIELKHLLWSLMWVRIWKARGIWCSWTESKTVKLSIWLLKSTSRFLFFYIIS